MPILQMRAATTLHALFVALLLVLGAIVLSGAWLVAATLCASHAGWMALGAALSAIVLLRLAHVPSSGSRVLLAMLATATAIVLANWLVVALPIGQAMGLLPLEAARRIGPNFGWMLIKLGNTPLDWLWMVVALALAAWFGR